MLLIILIGSIINTTNKNRALGIDINYAPAYNGRGLVYDKLNDYEKACIDFNKAIDLDPTNPVYIHNRGCCKRSMNK